jgi:putative hemolysin
MRNTVPTGHPATPRALIGKAPLANLLLGLQRGAKVISLPPSLAPTPKPGPSLGFGPVLGRIGSLEVRLATTRKDIKRAQRLRYRVFFEEMSAIPDMVSRFKRRDIDGYDAICDHLLVIDHDAPARFFGKGKRRKPRVVGTYRLLRQDVAERHVGFYTQSEFDIAPIIAAHPGARFLELGRSCVLEPYRDKRTVELLWHGIWTYVLHHRIDVMFGCASFAGTDPDALALPLSFLHHHARAPEDWRVAALPRLAVPMDRLPRDSVDPKLAIRQLPPLLKGYLRVGATFGDGAVIDRQFGTTDVLVILPVSAINPRYVEHFGVDASRHAA